MANYCGILKCSGMVRRFLILILFSLESYDMADEYAKAEDAFREAEKKADDSSNE